MANDTVPKRDFRQEVTDSIVSMIERGVAPWQKPWEPTSRLPFNPTTEKSYRGGNALHLMAIAANKTYSDPRWLTYKQAEQNGWHVKKGEKGAHIEFWQFPESPEQPANDKAPPDTPVHRVYTVFNAQQIEGIPAYQPKNREEWEIVQAGESILQNSGVPIHHDQSDRAFYNRQTDDIHLPPKEAFKSAGNFYGTTLHELAHASGHPTRLNRATLNESYRFGDPAYAKEELRAELTSVFLAAERGIPHNPEQHAAYVQSWIAALKNDKNEIFRAAKDAHHAADYLLQFEQKKELRQENSEWVAQYERGSGTVDTIEKQTATEHHSVTPTRQDVKIEQEKILDGEVNGRRPAADDLNLSFDQAEDLTKRALGDNARVYHAQTESGTYQGQIIGATDHHLIQQLSPASTVAHPKHALNGAIPAEGQHARINYTNHLALPAVFEPKAKSHQLAR